MNVIQSNSIVMKKLLIFTVAMFGFGFALVPFYEKICEVTGINNLLQADTLAENTQVDTSRWVTVQLDANTRGLPWEFKPLQSTVRIHPGELVQVMYEVRNNSNREINGQAIPSYSPQLLAKHLKKLECFCFSKQVLKPNEVRQMPVQFMIEPGLPVDYDTVTISYTFFELGGDKAADAGSRVSKS
ncbi:cytochrome c oxidase assembly protein [Nitrosospira sp. Nsp13]|jgi:cytochrome c oxidase assembly protein subunit 11|uniref:cytochrome c oxidase assembly protein n=1 Tax=Nitrosospira sp. Nsp13 TaxID=1855332 RepID=UPI000887BFF7|nr:cytochrome c oxidase assembly protein [Nitrosospira sp. Nsp13]SCY56765.1 cytochrome c oxidase assembly protein subunit 11 [Nitrosospira sp. Nsp13]